MVSLEGLSPPPMQGAGAYVMPSKMEAKLETTVKVAGYPRYIIDDDGMVVRRPYHVTNLIAVDVTKGTNATTTKLFTGTGPTPSWPGGRPST